MNVNEMDLDALPEGDLVLHVPMLLSKDQRERIAAHFSVALPDRKVLVIDGGMTLSTIGHTAQLQRIEQKLDALLKALAAEDDGDDDVRSLDGKRFPAREEGRSLG